MPSSELFSREALESWIVERCPDIVALRIERLEEPKAGFSNETVFVRARVETREGEVERSYVLRRAGVGEAIYPVQIRAAESSVDLQQRVMRALFETGDVLVPDVVGWEPSVDPLGRPFFLMTFVEGRVLPDYPSYVTEGFFAESADPEVRRRHVETGLAALATVHRVDWRGAGLEWLDRGWGDGGRMMSQLGLWRAYTESVPACRDHRLLASALSWLEENRPDEPEAALGWGDARIQNMIFSSDGDCRAIVDWEGAAILPPEVDLAWWLGVDHFVHEASGVARLPGELSPSAQVEFYEARLGRPVRDLSYYRVFAAFRTVALMLSSFDRLREMGISDAGSAEDNPYEVLLRDAMGSASAPP